MDIAQAVLGQLEQQGGLDAVSQLIGADSDGVKAGLQSAIPAILAGMANNASSPEGAGSLLNALSNDHDGSVLDDIGGFLGGGGNLADGVGILGHVFGNREDQITQGVAKQTGLNIGTIARLLPIVAPIIMGMLGKKQREAGLDAGGLGSLLQQERQQAEAESPGLGGLASLIDQDQDGSIMDEVLGMVKGLFKG